MTRSNKRQRKSFMEDQNFNQNTSKKRVSDHFFFSFLFNSQTMSCTALHLFENRKKKTHFSIRYNLENQNFCHPTWTTSTILCPQRFKTLSSILLSSTQQDQVQLWTQARLDSVFPSLRSFFSRRRCFKSLECVLETLYTTLDFMVETKNPTKTHRHPLR